MRIIKLYFIVFLPLDNVDVFHLYTLWVYKLNYNTKFIIFKQLFDYKCSLKTCSFCVKICKLFDSNKTCY